MDLGARLIRDVEAALDDDLHLVVGVLVHKRRALLQAVEPGRYGLLWVSFLSEDLLATTESTHRI